MNNTYYRFLCILAVASLLIFCRASAQTYLPKDFVTRSGKVVCGFLNGAWVPGRTKGYSFYSLADDIKKLRVRLRKARGQLRRELQKEIVQLYTKIDSYNVTLCSSLSPIRSSIGTIDLSQLPYPGSVAAQNESAVVSGYLTPIVPTAKPPSLNSIAEYGAADYFWSRLSRYIPEKFNSDNFCKTFMCRAMQDPGLAGCNLAQDIARSFAPVAESDRSLCLLNKTVAQTNIDSGALRALEGSVPPEDVTKIFLEPEGSASRVIKLLTRSSSGAGETIFLRVHPHDTNVTNGRLYGVDIWSCNGDSLIESNAITVTTDGRYQDRGWKKSSSISTTVGGYLKTDSLGAVVFDAGKIRTVEAVDDTSHKEVYTDMLLTEENIMRLKVYEPDPKYLTLINGTRGDIQYLSARRYGEAQFTGAGVNDIRLVKVAMKQQWAREGDKTLLLTGTSIFSAWQKQYLATASLVSANLNDDPFFSSRQKAPEKPSDISCGAEASIVLLADMSNSDLSAAIQQCAVYNSSATEMCENTLILRGTRSWFENCSSSCSKAQTEDICNSCPYFKRSSQVSARSLMRNAG